jgi:hypothetical protein
MDRYELWCSLHGFEMPPHLRLPPSARAGWGGPSGGDPLRDWVRVRIARRCLRRRINPTEFMNLVRDDYVDSKYPPPIEHYLNQIDVRSRDMPAGTLAKARASLRSFRLRLRVQLFYLTGRTADHDVNDLTMALDDHELSSQPFLMFCFARIYSIPHVSERVAPMALIEYACKKHAFDEIFGDHIPAPLRWAGEALYDLVDREGD